MKKLILPAILSAFVALMLTSTSCNDKVCIKCYKIGDSTNTVDYCSSNQWDRNDFIVTQTHADYNCVTVSQ
jgi:hypothetical protein